MDALEPTLPPVALWCIDCGAEIDATDVEYGVMLNDVFDGRCKDCLHDLNEPASDVPIGEGRRVVG